MSDNTQRKTDSQPLGDSKVDLLYVMHAYPPANLGGAALYTKHLAEAVANDISVGVLTAEDGRGSLTIDEEGAVKLFKIPFIRPQNLGETIYSRAYRKLFRNVLKIARPSVVHIMGLVTISGSILEELIKQKIPYYVHVHDYWFLCPNWFLMYAGTTRCKGSEGGALCSACFSDMGQPVSDIQISRSLNHCRLEEKYNQFFMRLLASSVPPLFFRPDSQNLKDINSLILNLRPEYFKNLLARSEKIFVPSRFVQGTMAHNGYSAQMIEIKTIGVVPIDPQVRLKSDTIRFGYVGGLSPIKGCGTLLEAFKKIPASEKAVLKIYGIGKQDEQVIKSYVSDDSRISLHGKYRYDELPSILKEIDILVLPSLSDETFSIVAREAVMSGAPVIASDVGALGEFIVHGENGMLFTPGNIEELAVILKTLCSQKIVAQALITNSERWALRNKIPTIDSDTKYFISLYKSHMAGEEIKDRVKMRKRLDLLRESVPQREGLFEDLDALKYDANSGLYDFTFLDNQQIKGFQKCVKKAIFVQMVPFHRYENMLTKINEDFPDSEIALMTGNKKRLERLSRKFEVLEIGQSSFSEKSVPDEIKRQIKESGFDTIFIPLNRDTMAQFFGYNRAVFAGMGLGMKRIVAISPDGEYGGWTRVSWLLYMTRYLKIWIRYIWTLFLGKIVIAVNHIPVVLSRF